MPTINVVTITDNGSAVNPVVAPTRGFGNYVESGHDSVRTNAETVAAILQANGIGESSSLSGSREGTTLPNNASTARNSQHIFHVHVSKQDADQVFFKWAWTAQTGTLAITTSPPIKHK